MNKEKYKRLKRTVRKTLFLLCLITGVTILHAQEGLYPNEFPAGNVHLLDGPFKKARDLNIHTLLQYDTDRLLAGFRKEAGLAPTAATFPNWDGLEGHIGGHYLSALAMNLAATGNPECEKRLLYMISELKECAAANNKKGGWATGYLGAVPKSEQIWSGFIKGDFAPYHAAWVPFYNVHKMYAGLRDAWLYAGNADAKELFLAFCDWAIMISNNLSETQMQSVLDMEHGGMNEVLADAYQMTGYDKYLDAAKKFSHFMLLDAMKTSTDNLDNKHANTQVPKAVGFERIGELSADADYLKAGNFFWETVVTRRTLAFGGNSRREFFPAVASSRDFVNDVEGPETCNSYNMLKLTETVFRVEPLAKYADYYERTLYNHILSTQHPQHGGYVYFTPARPRHYRVYSSPNQAMWCCVGSGMENHGKYGQFIYTHTKDSLFVNLFIASTVDWKEKNIQLKQETSYPEQERTKIIVTGGSATITLLIRYPGWMTKTKPVITVNGKTFTYNNSPSSYIAIRRTWKKGDVINISLPMTTRVETMPNLPSYIAFMRGPILLAARTGTDSLRGLIANDSRWGHIAGGERLPIEQSPIIIDNQISDLGRKLLPVKGKPLTWSTAGIKFVNGQQLLLEPFNKIHDSRYMMYWMALDNAGYRKYLDSFALVEQKQLDLQKRTVDFVAPGEQQPEADHFMKQLNSTTGNQQNEFWRSATDSGYFSYQLSTGKQLQLALLVKYWGAEWGKRKFDIFIDDEKLLTVDNTGKWNQSEFQQTEYTIPSSMLNGKEKIRVKFQSYPGSTAGAVYYIRLVKNIEEK
ncbi:MAG: glycoside hydrolase family 127 protein [Chitinophagaceae bacterium]